MNIGVFTDSFRPYASGVVRSIELFSREYANRGHSVHIFCPEYPHMHLLERGKYLSVCFNTLADYDRLFVADPYVCNSKQEN